MDAQVKTNGIDRRQVPLRTCIGCRRCTSTLELVRVVLAPDLQISAVSRGRGAWLCRNQEEPDKNRPRASCIELATKKGGWKRAFRRDVPPELLGTFPGLVTQNANHRSA